MNDQTIGTCSICGGAVKCPLVFHSVIPPVPECSRCGARPREHGPVIQMEPRIEMRPYERTVQIPGKVAP